MFHMVLLLHVYLFTWRNSTCLHATCLHAVQSCHMVESVCDIRLQRIFQISKMYLRNYFLFFGPMVSDFAPGHENLPGYGSTLRRHRWNCNIVGFAKRTSECKASLERQHVDSESSLREANFRVRGIVGTAAVPPCPVTLRAL